MASTMKWQRGAADIISVWVGMTILAIVMAGTAASMVYGREALMREEHRKAVAFMLRGKMEEVQAQLQLPEARAPRYLMPETYRPEAIETARDLNGISPIQVTLSRDRIRLVDEMDPKSGYVITVHAEWRERDTPENLRTDRTRIREMTFTTATIIRSLL